ncbi:MAG: hypothetical protein WC860_03035 [Candidatus Margulisiibacteriota bacterium]|jgi:hypothetical protein
MEIVLILTTSSGKNALFVNNSLKALSIHEVIQLTQSKILINTQIVHSKNGTYIRTKQNKQARDNLDVSTISQAQLWKACLNLSYGRTLPLLNQYEKIKNENVSSSTEADRLMFLDWDNKANDFIIPVLSKTPAEVINHLQKYQQIIRQAAEQQQIDIYFLASILIDEYLRMGPDDWFDWLGAIGVDTSIGLAQIKITTALKVIKRKLYTPDPAIDLTSIINRPQLYKYLNTPYHSCMFSAAIIKDFIETWKPYIDLSNRLDVIGTLYSLKYIKPHATPHVNKRGLQIQNEFYLLAQQVFAKN